MTDYYLNRVEQFQCLIDGAGNIIKYKEILNPLKVNELEKSYFGIGSLTECTSMDWSALGQSAVTKEIIMKATQEQVNIVTAARSFDDMTINACAGSGKTTSLKQITQAHPQANALLFCFNKSIQQQAQASMPTWCKSSTFHGIAYGQIGKYFAHKLKVPLSPFSICRALRLKPNEQNIHLATVGKVRRSKGSASRMINAILGFHVPHESVMAKNPGNRNAFKEEVVMMWEKVWTLAMNAKEKDVGD